MKFDVEFCCAFELLVFTSLVPPRGSVQPGRGSCEPGEPFQVQAVGGEVIGWLRSAAVNEPRLIFGLLAFSRINKPLSLFMAKHFSGLLIRETSQKQHIFDHRQ